jgi:hypothetical protein
MDFELDYRNGHIKVQRITIGAQVIFRVQFPDRRSPLVLTRAEHANANRFWTSVPEGRQPEAEEIGPLIANHLLSKK